MRHESSTSTKWRPWAGRARVEVFADPVAGYGVGPAGRFTFTAGARNIAPLLRALPDAAERVYLVGPIPGGNPNGFRSWATPPGRWPKGWSSAPAGHYVERPENPVLKYSRRLPDGFQLVEIHRAAAWFGEDDYSAELAAAARGELARLVTLRFPKGPGLLATPATTGVELWRSLIPFGQEWPVLGAELRELIRATMGQGRFEFFPPAPGTETDGLYVVDGRLMYGALCRELPAGEPFHDLSGTFHGHARARYRYTATVPPGWARLGLLGRQGADGRWSYPARPGEQISGWADGAELLVATRNGWTFTIHEAWVWPGGGPDPLRPWAERLIALRREVLRAGADTGPLIANALRALLIFGIGRFGAGVRYLTRSAPITEPGAVPAGAVRPRVEGDRIVWGEAHEPDPSLSHPEWAAAIYGRARARLLHSPTGTRDVFAGALHCEPADLVRLALDSLTLTAEPAWPDDGLEGRLRLKSRIPGPLVVPGNESALNALQRSWRRTYREGVTANA